MLHGWNIVGQIFREDPYDQEKAPPNQQNYPQIGQSNGVYSKVFKKCLISRSLPAKHTLKSHVPLDHSQNCQPQQLAGICILKKNYDFSVKQSQHWPITGIFKTDSSSISWAPITASRFPESEKFSSAKSVFQTIRVIARNIGWSWPVWVFLKRVWHCVCKI